ARYNVLHETVLAVADHARAILPPRDVHGIDQVQQHFGVTYAEQQLLELIDLPWPDEVLRACASTHVLVAGYPLAIDDLQKRHPALFRADNGKWPFASATTQVNLRWYLIRKSWVPGSLGKTYADQLGLLPPDQEVPRACEMTFALLLH